jgi:hypothetical protein
VTISIAAMCLAAMACWMVARLEAEGAGDDEEEGATEMVTSIIPNTTGAYLFTVVFDVENGKTVAKEYKDSIVAWAVEVKMVDGDLLSQVVEPLVFSYEKWMPILFGLFALPALA